MKLISREKILEHFSDMRYWAWNYRAQAICWNIKVSGFSSNGRKYESGEEIVVGVMVDLDTGEWREFTNNPRWDERWEEFLEEDADDGHLFWAACRDWLGFVDGVYDTVGYDLDTPHQYEFEVAGRSGGWLVLTEFMGVKMRGQDLDDPEEWTYLELWELYKFVKMIDEMVERIPQHMAYYYAQHRNLLETEEWDPQAIEDEEAAMGQVGPMMEVQDNGRDK